MKILRSSTLRVIVVAYICLTVLACTPAWTKVGFSPSVFKADSAECDASALQQYPPDLETRTVYTTNTECERNWKGEMECHNVPGETWETYDANLQKRNSYQEACLRTRGYFREGEQ